MNAVRAKQKKPIKKIPPPPDPDDVGYDALVAYLHQYDPEDLEKAGYLTEPSPEEIRDVEEAAERDLAREKVKGLAKDYPKASGQKTARLASLLKCVAGLKPAERKGIASSLNVIADKCHDLDEILERLLEDEHTPEEVAELLLAVDTMLEYICSYADGLGAKLLGIFDQVKGLTKNRGKDHHGHRHRHHRP